VPDVAAQHDTKHDDVLHAPVQFIDDIIWSVSVSKHVDVSVRDDIVDTSSESFRFPLQFFSFSPNRYSSLVVGLQDEIIYVLFVYLFIEFRFLSMVIYVART
jgi:hypothetical protein